MGTPGLTHESDGGAEPVSCPQAFQQVVSRLVDLAQGE